MKRFPFGIAAAAFALLGLCLLAKAAEKPVGTSIDLWPEGIAGHRDGGPAEVVNTKEDKVYHVRTPTLTAFFPPAGKACGTAVIYCPGGGYVRLPASQDGGGERRWLNDLGIAVFVLKYRFGDDGPSSALKDVLRAIRIVRSRAAEFGVRADHIGVFGGSAGGHVATCAATLYDDPDGKTGAALDNVSGRPDFVAVLYPVVTMEDPYVHKGSRTGLLGPKPSPELKAHYSTDQQVTKSTPPTFLVSTQEDRSVPMENSIMFFEAMHKAGAPVEMHLYEKGPHGFGFNPNMGPTSEWPKRIEEWLRYNGWIPAAKS